MTTTEYTDAQATDEAVLLLVRKLRRTYQDVYAEIIAKLPQGAQDALMLADQRADKLRMDGVTREYRNIWASEDGSDDE